MKRATDYCHLVEWALFFQLHLPAWLCSVCFSSFIFNQWCTCLYSFSTTEELLSAGQYHHKCISLYFFFFIQAWSWAWTVTYNICIGKSVMWWHLIDLLNYRPVAHILASLVKHTPMLNPRYWKKRAAERLTPSVSCLKQQTANRKQVEFAPHWSLELGS